MKREEKEGKEKVNKIKTSRDCKPLYAYGRTKMRENRTEITTTKKKKRRKEHNI
jgi:hypothetical protein